MELVQADLAYDLWDIEGGEIPGQVEDGEIVESGNHNSLIKQKGNYYKIFKKQNEEEELD